MNRSWLIDSEFELDQNPNPCDVGAMSIDTVPFVILERLDPARNMARYYVLSIEQSLFGDTALVRHWGRLGRNGRQRIDLFRQRAHAIETLEAWFARKTRRAYIPRQTSIAPSN
jgi:predicted DNA-binding WGR domain protein